MYGILINKKVVPILIHFRKRIKWFLLWKRKF